MVSPWTPDTFPFRSQRRFVAALLVSVLVHAALTAGLTSGSFRARGERGPAPAISVTLHPAEPEPPRADVAPQRATPVAPPRRAEATPTPQSKRADAPARAQPPSPASATAAGPSEIPDPTYYGARQLDVYPVPASELALRYPASAAAGDVRGHVLLLVLIDASGVVDEVSVVEAQPPGFFEEHAKRTFQSARFKPALKNGRAVKSRLVVNVSYGESAP